MKSSATNQKIAWFWREEDAGSLDLSPSFQRKPVWSDEQASYLIDTILNNLPFPEIYLRSSSSPQGKTLHEVVDGQQRIRSILQFIRNDLALLGERVTAKWTGQSFENLTDEQKQLFWDYEIVVRDLGGSSDAEIRDLFQRLNINSVLLTDQELRHAQFKGHFLQLMESLADDEWWVEMRIVNPRQIRRMEDVEYISELFIGLLAGPQDKKKSLDDYYEDYDSEMPEANEWARKFRSNRDLLTYALKPSAIRAWSGKSDFYSLFHAFGAFSLKDFRFLKRRKAVRERLRKFRAEVNLAKRKDNKTVFSPVVHEYADAVTRAASDVARREVRQRILENIIKAAIDGTKTTARARPRARKS